MPLRGISCKGASGLFQIGIAIEANYHALCRHGRNRARILAAAIIGEDYRVTYGVEL